jgi:hypothetical protein
MFKTIQPTFWLVYSYNHAKNLLRTLGWPCLLITEDTYPMLQDLSQQMRSKGGHVLLLSAAQPRLSLLHTTINGHVFQEPLPTTELQNLFY